MPDRQNIVEAAFLAAIELPEGDGRERVLRERCNGDAGLMAEVRSLLGGHEAAGGVLDRRSLVSPASPGMGPIAGGGLKDDPALLRPGQRLGAYTIRRLLGAGGMGVVYVAEQERPRRTVALKVIRAGMFAGSGSASLLRRFEHEAEVLGRLHHPGIAQIFEAGAAVVEGSERGPVPFLAMELIDGLPLTEHAEKNGLPTDKRLALMAEVGEAVQHAHQRGVIHRDLKPSNILVDASGGVKVLDFGVARVTDSDVRLTTMQTGVGQLIGTLAYMSPEQVAEDQEAIDTRSDVYALGVVLYQLLTGKLPHDLTSRSLPEAARIIKDDPPSKLSSISRAFRGDIETIVAKALEKDKERRYGSAAALADDLRRYLAGEPITAKRDSLAYVLNKRVRRYRVLVGVGAAALVAVSAAGVYAAMAAVRSRRLAADLAVQLGRSTIEQARLMSRTEGAGVAEEMLWAEMAKGTDPTLTRWALWDLYSRSPCLSSIPDFEASSHDVCFSPDGALCAVANRRQGKVELWDRSLSAVVRTLDLESKRAFAVAFGPDGLALATGDGEGRLRLWEVASGRCTLTAAADAEWVGTLAYSRDGALLACGGKDGLVRLWDGRTGEAVRELRGHTDQIAAVAFTPDSLTLASASHDHTVRLWDIRTGECAAVLDKARGGHTFNVGAAAFSPDGGTLVTGGFDKQLKLWDMATLACRATVLSLAGYPQSIVFGADGSRFYVSHDGVEVRAAADGRLLHTITYPDATRRTIALDPGGEGRGKDAVLLCAATRGRVSLWETEPDLARSVFSSGVAYAAEAVFSPDGRTLATPGPRGTARLWPVPDPEGRATPHTHPPAEPVTLAANSAAPSPVRALAHSPDGRLIALGDIDGSIRLFDAASGSLMMETSAHPRNTVVALAFAPDGRTLASTGTDRAARLWSVPGLGPLGELTFTGLSPSGGGGATLSLAWSPDSSTLALGAAFVRMGLWRPGGPTGLEPAASVDVQSPQSAVRFSPDGARVLIGIDRAIIVADVRTGAVVRRITGHSQGVTGLGFVNDGLLASASRDRTVRLWAWPDGLPLLSLSTGDMQPTSLSVSPDGRRAACSLDRGGVAVWDLHYYDRHIAGNAEWSLNRVEGGVSDEARARIMGGLGPSGGGAKPTP